MFTGSQRAANGKKKHKSQNLGWSLYTMAIERVAGIALGLDLQLFPVFRAVGLGL
jgi:hypothetical protein